MRDVTKLSDKDLLDKHEHRLTNDCEYPELDEAEMKKWSDEVAETHLEILRRLARGENQCPRRC